MPLALALSLHRQTQTHRQTNKHTDTDTDTDTDRQTDRHTDTQTHTPCVSLLPETRERGGAGTEAPVATAA